jgi:hypothetical protein
MMQSMSLFDELKIDRTTPEAKETLARFARAERRQGIALLLGVIAIVALIVAARRGLLAGAGWFARPERPGLLVALALLAYSFRNWRCPACSAYLGKRLDGGRCRSCGVQLRR